MSKHPKASRPEPQPPDKANPGMADLDPANPIGHHQPFLNYAFFKLDPAFRRLAPDVIETAKSEFAVLCHSWAQRGNGFVLRSYSLMGLRADTDFMLWRSSFEVQDFQEMQKELNKTRLGAYLSQPYSFLSLQKGSLYLDRFSPPSEEVTGPASQGPFLLVYPLVKTPAWYNLPPQTRQGIINEHTKVLAAFTGVRHNTSYSHGIDDQEFVVAIDCDQPQQLVELAQRLRFTEANLFTLRDTPMFTCIRKSIADTLDDLA